MMTRCLILLALLAPACTPLTPEQREEQVRGVYERQRCENRASLASGFAPWNDDHDLFPPSNFARSAKYRNALNDCLDEADLQYRPLSTY